MPRYLPLKPLAARSMCVAGGVGGMGSPDRVDSPPPLTVPARPLSAACSLASRLEMRARPSGGVERWRPLARWVGPPSPRGGASAAVASSPGPDGAGAPASALQAGGTASAPVGSSASTACREGGEMWVWRRACRRSQREVELASRHAPPASSHV